MNKKWDFPVRKTRKLPVPSLWLKPKKPQLMAIDGGLMKEEYRKFAVVETKDGFIVQNKTSYIVAYESMSFVAAKKVCDKLNRS